MMQESSSAIIITVGNSKTSAEQQDLLRSTNQPIRSWFTLVWTPIGLNTVASTRAAFLKQYADRVAYLHFKDMNPDGSFGEVGHGILDWERIMEAVGGIESEWLTVEQDRTDKTTEESVTMSCQYMRQTLGI